MLTQITPISYHTEAFVKTEVGCTVSFESEAAKICLFDRELKLRGPTNSFVVARDNSFLKGHFQVNFVMHKDIYLNFGLLYLILDCKF